MYMLGLLFLALSCVSVSLQVKRLLVRDDGKPLQVHQRLLAGSTAGVIAQTTIYPMEVSSLPYLNCACIEGGTPEIASFISEQWGAGSEVYLRYCTVTCMIV